MSKPRPPLEEMTLRQLRRIASLLEIPRYSRMRKAQLLKAIQIKKNNLQSDNTIDSGTKKKLLNSIKTNDLITEEIIIDLLGLDNVAIEEKEQNLPVNPMGNNFSPDRLADVGEELGELPQGYGKKKIVLMASDPRWAYAYWDISPEQKDQLRQQGGINLFLRLRDVSPVDSKYLTTFRNFEYICNELARDWYIPVPLSDRDYVVEIGYRCIDGKWLGLARSEQVHVPPLYPSEWAEDIFVSVPWEKPLTGEKIYLLPSRDDNKVKRKSKYLSPSFTSRVDSSLYRQLDHIPGSIPSISPISSYQFASGGSGLGMWPSGGGSGQGLMSGRGWASGAGLSGQFWLMANAKLTIYGATMPNARVTIGNQEIALNTDGTFSFQVSFPDGVLDFPIVAVSADGQETRFVEMKFERQTNFSSPEVKEASDNLEETSSILKAADESTDISSEDNDNASDWFPPIVDSTDKENDISDWFAPVDSTDKEDDISDWFPPIR